MIKIYVDGEYYAKAETFTEAYEYVKYLDSEFIEYIIEEE